MLKHTTAMATLALTLAASGASAADNSLNIDVSTFEDNARVSVIGTVDAISEKDEFTLRDTFGNTIDVETKEDISLNEGDRISVSGMVESDMFGWDKEIDASSIEILDRARGSMSNNMDNSASANTMLGKIGNDISNAASATGSAISNTASNAADTVTSAASNVADATSSRFNKMTNDAREWNGQRYGAIDALPKEGSVSIMGEVASVSDDMKQFTLRDNTGETIDIHTTSQLDVNEGDKVSVAGEMRSEIAGMGEEIRAFQVSVVSTK